jgi:hypothetical protein
MWNLVAERADSFRPQARQWPSTHCRARMDFFSKNAPATSRGSSCREGGHPRGASHLFSFAGEPHARCARHTLTAPFISIASLLSFSPLAHMDSNSSLTSSAPAALPDQPLPACSPGDGHGQSPFLAGSGSKPADAASSCGEASPASGEAGARLLPPVVCEMAARLARAYRLNEHAAQLMALAAIATAAGPVCRLWNPLLGRLIASNFNLFLLQGEDSFCSGALRTLLAPFRDHLEAAALEHRFRGISGLQAAFSERTSQEEEMIMAERDLRPPRGSICDPGFLTAERDFKQTVTDLREQRLHIRSLAADVRAHLDPVLISEDLPWTLVLGDNLSFDGAFSFLSTGARALQEFARANTPWRREILRLLQSSRRGEVFIRSARQVSVRTLTNLWCADLGDLTAMLRCREVAQSEILSTFLLVEADACPRKPLDAEAFRSLDPGAEWKELIEWLLRQRKDHSDWRVTFRFASFSLYLEFREWCGALSAGCAPALRPFIREWPETALHLALGIALAQHPKTVEDQLWPEAMESAIALLKALVPGQLSLLERMVGGAATSDGSSPMGETFPARGRGSGRANGAYEGLEGNAAFGEEEAALERLVDKVRAKGPLTLRDLVRSYDRQNYAWLEALVARAEALGLLRREGKWVRMAQQADPATIAPAPEPAAMSDAPCKDTPATTEAVPES